MSNNIAQLDVSTTQMRLPNQKIIAKWKEKFIKMLNCWCQNWKSSWNQKPACVGDMSHSIFCQQVLCYAKKIWATDIITKLSIYGWGKIILMIIALTIIIIIGDNNDDADDCSGNVGSFLASQHFLSPLPFLSLPNKMALMMITLY